MSDPVLQEILSKNQHSEIGRRWKFGEITNIETFRQNVPLTTYDDYKPLIDRIVERGEQDLTRSFPVSQFSLTSGTTGVAKYIPGAHKLPSLDFLLPSGGKKILHLVNISDKKNETPFGMPIQGISVRVVRYMIEARPNNYVVPLEACCVTPLSLALYIQLLLGLKEPNIEEISSVFIPIVINAVMILKSRWKEIVQDIRSGKLALTLPLSDEKRDALERILGGQDPSRADTLQKIFEQAEHVLFRDILALVWPKLRLIKCLCSGNMSCFVPTLKHYCGPNIHISSYWFGCTEVDAIGIPAKPLEEVSLFRLAPNNFYEFIPIELSHDRNPQTLLSHEVEKGKVYELIVTSVSGWYRYRFGDYVEIIEQTEDGPLFDFNGREKMTLKLGGHSLFEANIEKTMTSLTRRTSSRVDYTVSINDATYSGYKVWIETLSSDIAVDRLSHELDQCLQQVDSKYEYDRSSGRLDQLAIAFVNPGTFAAIFELMKSRTLNAEAQLKIPRMVFLPEIHKILKQNVLKF